MQFSAAVQFLEAVDELRQGAPNPIDVGRSRSAHVIDERRPVDVLHREETLPLVDDEVVQRCEVGVRDAGQAAELPLQAKHIGGIPAQQRLERDDLIPRPIVDLVNDAHAADANLAADAVAVGAVEQASGGQRHGREVLERLARHPGAGNQQRGIFVEIGGLYRRGEQRFDLAAHHLVRPALHVQKRMPIRV